ncbi:MAG TPA: MBL fold metallo-hydrolase [Thermoanaerobaculia bacterium]|nr:MBL fold metallo-hydrolase [Thermoanaerobaculia bacterium]
MIFHQFYLPCLAHASYLAGSNGECAIVDPQRDVDQYIDEAARRSLTIKFIIETHLHADFVSGHRELAARTGAEIVFGAAANAEFPHRAVHDGDVLRVGDIELHALATPGHTPESISWLIVDDGKPVKVLTGDTLFIGDVGRPDLAGARGFTSEQMAALLYHSLHAKILALPDDVEVWPAHGAGSACGKNISKETFSTIGIQRRTNYALQPMPREEFVKMLTTEIAEPPPYFRYDAEMNRRGARALVEIDAPALTPQQVRERDAIVLDVRDSDSFAAGHLPHSINIALGGQYASWAGTLLSPKDRIAIVAESAEKAREAVMRLARVGFENVAGFLDGGVLAWSNAGLELDQMPQISVAELHDIETRVLDVRRAGEFEGGHVPGAINIPLHELQRRIDEVQAPVTVICAGGYRSSAAVSILAQHGLQATNVIGGTAAWIRAGFETVSS